MALEENQQRIQYTISSHGSGAFPITALNFPFPYYDEEDIVVEVLYTTGLLIELRNPTNPSGGQYQINPTNGDTLQGATLVFSNTTIPIGVIVTIARVVDFNQEYDLQEGATIDPTALNTGLDRIVAQNQQQNNSIERSISHPIGDPDGLNYDVPSAAARAGKTIGYDAAGNVTVLDSGGAEVYGDTQRGISIQSNFVSARIDENRAIQFNSLGQIGVKDGGITAEMLDPDFISDGQLDLDFLQNINTGKILGNVSGSINNVAEVNIDGDLINNQFINDTSVSSSKAIQQLINYMKPNIEQTFDNNYRVINSSKSPFEQNQQDGGNYDTSWETLSSFECTITPKFDTSKIRLFVNIVCSPDNRNQNIYFRVKRNIQGVIDYVGLGETPSPDYNQLPCSFVAMTNGYLNNAQTTTFAFVDTPALTENIPVTYSLEWNNSAGEYSRSTRVIQGERYLVTSLGTTGSGFDWTAYGAPANPTAGSTIFIATTTARFPSITSMPEVKLLKSTGTGAKFSYEGWGMNGSYLDVNNNTIGNNGTGNATKQNTSPRATSSIILEEIYQ